MLSFFSAPLVTAHPIVKVTNEKTVGVPSGKVWRERQLVWLQMAEVTLSLWHHDVLVTEVGKVLDGADYLSALFSMRPAEVAADFKITEATQLRLEANARIKQVAYLIDVSREEWLPFNGVKPQRFKRGGALADRKSMECVLGEGKVWASDAGEAGNLALLNEFLHAWRLLVPFHTVVEDVRTIEVSDEPQLVCTL
ncbi:hypothetical protein [Pseudomonas serbica]|jgi:hypothetical protein|uniref:hypothetical protein n=1 Tax=Pseudomonas serbica TaxID=2965074 RepID=UPI00237B59A9|nr:hypothetical protein [Pseudomonas serbica]